MDEVAARFRDLWHALTVKNGMPRDGAEASMLIDRVRDALDRRVAAPGEGITFVAGTFSIETTVHEGLMTVYRLRHRDLGFPYAMKTVSPTHADDPVLRGMLLDEARIMLRLDHPQIVRTHMLLRLEDGRPALVMEWIETTLAAALHNVSLTPADIRTAAIALMQGVHAIGCSGYVHGDLAPSNLLLRGSDFATLRITDFGTSIKIGTRSEDYGMRLAGRPSFAAPEQIEGRALDARTDIHACGRILSLLLGASDHNTGSDEQQLAALAIRMQSPNPEDRPRNAAEVLEMLNAPS